MVNQKLIQYITVIIGSLMAGYLVSIFLGKIIFLILGTIVFLIFIFFILKNPIYGLYLIAFFLPFERIGSYELGGFTVRLSQLLALITIFAWITQMLIQKKVKVVRNPLLLPLGLFIFINFLSLINAENLRKSFLTFLFLLFTILFALTIPNLIKKKDEVSKIIFTLFLGCFLVCVFGLWQFAGDMMGLSSNLTGLRPQYTKTVLGFPRIQATALEPLYFANYLLTPLALALVFFLSKFSFPLDWFKTKHWYLELLLIIIIINLVLTVARGGYIAGIFILLAIGFIYFKKVITLQKVIPMLVVAGIIGYIIIRILTSTGEPLESNLEKFKFHATNIFAGAAYEERLEMYEKAFSAFRSSPLLGIGIGGYGPSIALHPYIEPREGWKIVNNEFLEILVETGILGMVTFFIFIFMILARSYKAIKFTEDLFLKTIMIALTIAFIGILIQYQTFSILYIMHIWFLIGFMIAVQNMAIIDSQKYPFKNPKIFLQ